MRKDALRDNWSYQRGILHPHGEMPLDPDLPEIGPVRAAAPLLYHLPDDPGEERNLAREHPAIVRELAAAHDAWFADVSAEWTRANRAIRAHDERYWAARPVPEPRRLLGDFWVRYARGAAAGQDPLRIVPGYWSRPGDGRR
jgi:hypothetical protein